MKKILCVLLCMFVSALCACGGTGNTGESTSTPAESSSGDGQGSSVVKPVTNKTYGSWWFKQADYKTMPICAFNGAPPKTGAYTASLITDEHYAAMKEAGFNASYALYDNVSYYTDEIVASLALAEKYGISYVAGGSGFPTASDMNVLETQIYNTLIKNNPKALGGVAIMDEPSYVNFAAMKTARDTFEKLLSKKMLYHGNLFPDYASVKQLYNRGDDANYPLPEEGYPYEKYVEDYIAAFNPQVLSYDYYPCRSNGTMSSGYFGNMSVIRKAALKAEIPFWVYIQTCKFSGGTRIPSENDLYWLVNTSLAYGCKGLQYFTYTVPLSSGGEYFEGALVSASGEKTDLWYSAKKINAFVAEIDEVLMCCISEGLMTAGDSPAPIPEEDVLESYGSLVSVSGGSALIGCFDYKGSSAFYVVNNDYSASGEITLGFSESVNGYSHSLSGKKTFSGSSLTVELEGGEAALVVLEG